MTHQDIIIPEEVFDWYDSYAHGGIDRREFMTRLGKYAVGGLTVAALAGAILPNYALAEQVSFNDPEIKATYETFLSPDGHGEGRGYYVSPRKADGPQPAVLVVHENRGLNPYVKDVARRLAKAGFIAFAPDALHPLGGYPGNDDEGRKMQRSMDRSKIEADFKAAAKFLKTREDTTEKTGVVGFCFGGFISNMLAAEVPDLIDASVPYYGSPARLETIKNIKAPMMHQLGSLDKRINQMWPSYEAALKAGGVDFRMHMYADAHHGFHNDSTRRFKKDAADLSWERTLAFFKEHLA
ncbi:dienelactone hydrolase family protein [Temperatibacter marinus]|uniref:Dienelactone hydrolase family protein n=1 Tax=Temperatibacter marinus TaxID=1456591 RepID=A0AA52EHN4_9PROT|nr:dienelactone hydrolase family protein [Temperatibacter marinus]WND02689.1 dienelactone hydrolase family protein [Temperatibacter marinus]